MMSEFQSLPEFYDLKYRLKREHIKWVIVKGFYLLVYSISLRTISLSTLDI